MPRAGRTIAENLVNAGLSGDEQRIAQIADGRCDGDIILLDAIDDALSVDFSGEEPDTRREAWRPRTTVEFGSGTIWKYAQTVGNTRDGASTHPGARNETQVHADI
jgi:dihydroxyacid dehydratase/phosphogluconate dehydratase